MGITAGGVAAPQTTKAPGSETFAPSAFDSVRAQWANQSKEKGKQTCIVIEYADGQKACFSDARNFHPDHLKGATCIGFSRDPIPAFDKGQVRLPTMPATTMTPDGTVLEMQEHRGDLALLAPAKAPEVKQQATPEKDHVHKGPQHRATPDKAKKDASLGLGGNPDNFHGVSRAGSPGTPLIESKESAGAAFKPSTRAEKLGLEVFPRSNNKADMEHSVRQLQLALEAAGAYKQTGGHVDGHMGSQTMQALKTYAHQSLGMALPMTAEKLREAAQMAIQQSFAAIAADTTRTLDSLAPGQKI